MQNQGWQEKDLLSTLTFYSEITLKEPDNLGDIFSWEDGTGALFGKNHQVKAGHGGTHL